MTNQSINFSLDTDYYYIKRPHIVEKILFNNRTFYAKFEKINSPLTSLLIQQHLQKEFTIAIPLVNQSIVNKLLIEYDGDEYKRFIHAIKHLFKNIGIESYNIYNGKYITRVQVFIDVKEQTLEEADTKLQEISNLLSKKLTKKWKSLPSINLPQDYNIATLPYNQI